jgi:hypothetical protein
MPAAATRRNLRRESDEPESLLIMIVAFFLPSVELGDLFVVVERLAEASFYFGYGCLVRMAASGASVPAYGVSATASAYRA